ncbi:Long-chain-alcohol oxidase fao4a [Sarracenia purpurea var. burkii]
MDNCFKLISSGSGREVIVRVLAKADYKVLVLKQGNYYARSKLSLLEDPTMDRMYLGSELMATDDMGVVIVAGATVGSGSAINWSASIRTPKHVLKE